MFHNYLSSSFSNRYLQELKSYLESFFKRVKPLSNLDDIRIEAEKEFNEQWTKGKFPGWEKQVGVGGDLFCVACKYYFYLNESYILIIYIFS